MQLLGDTHPRFEVGKGSHGYFVPGETPSPLDPRTGADQSAADCGLPKDVVDELAHSDDYGLGDALVSVFVIPWVKAAAGAGLGLSLGGLAGAGVGALGGLIWGMAEGIDKMDGLHIRGTPSPNPTIDTVGTPGGMVVHPKDVIPPGLDPADPKVVEWRSQDDVTIGDPPRRYDSTVDRDQQILWPDDPAPNPPSSGVPNPQRKGFTGRWGPRVAADMETRRSGMRFPMFWLIFFEEMVRGARPSNVEFLTTGTSWTVPKDWNNAQNQIECIGGGGGGRAERWSAPGGGGGGGAYSSITNLTLTPGATLAYKIGAGGASGAPGEDTFFGDAAFATAKVGAKGGGSAAAGPSIGGAAAEGIGATKFSGGNGGAGGVRGGGGGGGAGGPKGDGAPGGNGSHVDRWHWRWWRRRRQRWRNGRHGFDPGAREGRRRREQSEWRGRWRRWNCCGKRRAGKHGVAAAAAAAEARPTEEPGAPADLVSSLMPRMALEGAAEAVPHNPEKEARELPLAAVGAARVQAAVGGTPGTAGAGGPGLIIIRYSP